MTKKSRRILAICLVVLGGLFILFAPETWGGILILTIGVLIEIVGIALEKKR
jgi:hypothetical protein